MKYYKVGETFEYHGNMLKAGKETIVNSCEFCIFLGINEDCPNFNCIASNRKDKTGVIFTEVKNVN